MGFSFEDAYLNELRSEVLALLGQGNESAPVAYEVLLKIVLSRKGTDSAAGGIASPIFPDGSLLSLPIPYDGGTVYNDINTSYGRLGPIVQGLSKGSLSPNDSCHLDPDLRAMSLQRHRAWRPLFGQTDAAQSHLEARGVGVGDVFLFFGWFRQAHQTDDGWRFVSGAPDLHVLWGWLQVAEIHQDMPLLLGRHAWAGQHPHTQGEWGPRNTIYVTTDRLSFGEGGKARPGAGVFPSFMPSLQLTSPGSSRSQWSLPAWFYPKDRPSSLSYHPSLDRWALGETDVQLKAAGRGQEFVLDADHYPEAIPWLCALIEATAH